MTRKLSNLSLMKSIASESLANNQTKPPHKVKPSGDPKKFPKGAGKDQKDHPKPKGETPCGYEPGGRMENPKVARRPVVSFFTPAHHLSILKARGSAMPDP